MDNQLNIDQSKSETEINSPVVRPEVNPSGIESAKDFTREQSLPRELTGTVPVDDDSLRREEDALLGKVENANSSLVDSRGMIPTSAESRNPHPDQKEFDDILRLISK